jgi:hypothetical protein
MASYPLGVADPVHVKRFTRALQALQDVPDPMQRLDAVRRSISQLEELQTATVAAARAAGVTWTEIGAQYGLSKQGAQQRFRPRKNPAP